jgi:alcohol dehydrogenase
MEYNAELNFTFGHTAKVVFGVNAVDTVRDLLADLGCQRAVIVTDSFLADKTEMVERLKRACGPRLAGVFAGVVPDPTTPSIDQGARVAADLKADLLISLGGGSAIDTAKAMAVVLTEGGQILDHEGYHNLRRRQTPHIAIPTTAGTGSEMTMVTVITDPKRGQKTFVGSYYLHPDVALLDPTLVTGLPAQLTAATGMDAMCHSVEGLFSDLRNPLSDGLGREAIKLIRTWLPRCLQEPGDLLARGQMLIAANMAGTCFSNAMVSLNHAIAHSLGALYHIHHGTLNAMLLPHSMRYFNDVASDRLAVAARALGIHTHSMSDEEAGAAAADRMAAFLVEIGLTKGLAELGVPADGPAKAAEMALSDGAIIYSPKPVFDTDEIEALIQQAM